MKEDRRVKRTKRLLKDGLTELLKEKQFSEISAKDITDRMDLNKATFYLHYKNTYELLQALEIEILDKAQDMIDNYTFVKRERSLYKLFDPLLDFLIENESICDALFVNNASSDFAGKVVNFIYKNGADLVKEYMPKITDDKADYTLNFISFGILGLLHNWFKQGRSISKEKLVNLADEIIFGINEKLNHENDKMLSVNI